MNAVDTSVVVAAFATWHEQHGVALRAVSEGTRLIGQVALESYAVLTRLPASHRAPPSLVREFLAKDFPGTTLVLSAREHHQFLSLCAAREIAGGAIYDACIAAIAARAGATLVTLDRRALPTYESMGAKVQLLN